MSTIVRIARGLMSDTVIVLEGNKESLSLQIGKLLKERRAELDITQVDLAKYCNLSREGIGKIESGHSDIQLSTLMKMSKILGFKITLAMEQD